MSTLYVEWATRAHLTTPFMASTPNKLPSMRTLARYAKATGARPVFKLVAAGK